MSYHVSGMWSGLSGDQEHPSGHVKLERPEKACDGQLVDFVGHLSSSFGITRGREFEKPKRAKSLNENS